MSQPPQPHMLTQREKVTNASLGNVLNLINNIYYCGPCSVQIETEDIFESHVLNHKFEGLYKCFHCPALGPDTTSITDHISQQHPLEDKYYSYLAFPQARDIIRTLKGLTETSQASERIDVPKSSSPQATSDHIISSKTNKESTVVSKKQQSTATDIASNSEKQSATKDVDFLNIVENIITTTLKGKQEAEKGKRMEPTASAKSTSGDEGAEGGPKQNAKVEAPKYRTIELSDDDDDSDIEITGMSRVPVPKTAASKAPESSKPNNSYETKLQCAYTNGQYVCKSCKLGSKYLSQFAIHVYSHLHEKKDGIHGCPYCPQDVAMGVSAINCKLVVQLLGILEKQKTAQELCKQGFSGNAGTFNTFEMGGNSAPITKSPGSGNMRPTSTNIPVPVMEQSTVPSLTKAAQQLDKQDFSNSTGACKFPDIGRNSPPVTKSTVSGSVQPASINVPVTVREPAVSSLTKPSITAANPTSPALVSSPQRADAPDQQNVVNISPIVITPIVIEPEESIGTSVLSNTMPETHPSSEAGDGAPNQETTPVDNDGSDSRESQSVSPSPSTSADPALAERAPTDKNGPPKSTIRLEDQKPGGRSIVRCYHEDDQFVCERCKYSIHHSKPKVFRKHLWFEVHPTRDCNHCPESSQYNRFKCCPIINQLMLYLLDAKAKKEKKRTEEAQKENPEALPSEEQVDDPKAGPNGNSVERNSSEQDDMQSKVHTVDHSRQTSSPLDQGSSDDLPQSPTEMENSTLSQTTGKPIEISPMSPADIADTAGTGDNQLDSSTADVIKMIQGLNNDLAPAGLDDSNTSVDVAEATVQHTSTTARTEIEGSGQSSQVGSSSSSTSASKGRGQNESNTDVITLSSEDETKDGNSQESHVAAEETGGQDLGVTNVVGATQQYADDGTAGSDVVDKQEDAQTICITNVVSGAAAPESNEDSSVPINVQESIANEVVDDGSKASTKENESLDLIMEVSDDSSETPNEDDNCVSSMCITNVVSGTPDEVVVEHSNGVENGKGCTEVSEKDSSAKEFEQGNTPGDDAIDAQNVAGQKASTDVDDDVDIQTVEKEQIEIPNASKRILPRRKRGLPIDKESDNDVTVKKVAKTSNKEIASKVKKTPSNSSKKTPTGNAYVCSFFKCNLWVAQDAGSFKIHNLLHHPNVKSLPCAFCSETFTKVEGLITHTNLTHVESDLIVVFKSYNCGFKDCWLACERAVDFLNHNQTVHPNVKSFPCCYCKQAFRTLAELVLHIDESVTYSCTVCPNVLKSTYADIRKHVLNSPHGSKKFLATGEVDSEIKLNLTCVLSNETGEIKYKSINRFVHVEKPVQEGSSQETFKCTKCSLISNDETSFEAHVIECAKKTQQKDNISLLRSARPAVFKKFTQENKNSKDSEAKASEKTDPNSSSNDKDKGRSEKTSSGNSGIQYIDSGKGSRRNTPIIQRQWDGDDTETPEDHVTEKSKHNKRKRESPEEQSNPDKDNRSHSLADAKDSSPVATSEDDDDNYLPDLDPPSSPELPPAPATKKGVLQSLGKGQSVSCEKCSFETEFRVVKAIHERVHLHDQDQLKLLWCPHCPYSTNEILHFKIHVQCHTEKTKIRLYNCGHCSLSSNKMDLIDDHHEEIHADLELKSDVTRLALEDLQCIDCTTMLKTEVELLEHMEQHHDRNSIQKYLKDMYNIASLKIVNDDAEHERGKAKAKTVTPVTEADSTTQISEYAQLDIDRFKCPCCEYSCHKYQTWARHIVRNHKSLTHEYIVFSCGMCKWKSTDKVKLIGHCEMKHNEITVVEQKLKLAEINVDIETEEDEKQKSAKDDSSCLHHCDFCSFSTYQKADLAAHWTTHEGQTVSSILSSDDEDTSDTIIVGETGEDTGTANIQEAGYSNYSKDTLRLIDDTILNLKHVSVTMKKNARCPICPFTSKFRNYMLKHLNFHKKTALIRDGFQCGYCLYISEFESVLTKHMKKDHAGRPPKKKVIGNVRLRFINELTTGEEASYASGEQFVLKEQKSDKKAVQDNEVSAPDRNEDSGGSSPIDIMEDEQRSSTAASDAVENRFAAGSTDMEDMSVNTKLRFSTRNIKQENEEKKNVTIDHTAPFSNMDEYFVQDGTKLEYTKDTLRLIDDMILNIVHSERGHYKGTLTCPICPLTSPDKCALRVHLQAHKSQACITDGYRCGYCLYTSEKLYPITRHQNQLHPRLPKKKIRIGIPDDRRASTKKTAEKQVSEINYKDVDDSNDSPGFMISAAVGSDGSTATVNINTPQNAEDTSVAKNQGAGTGIPMGVSQEMEEYCRSLYCIQGAGTNLFRCKKCTFADDDPGRVYGHFCTQHREDCPFQCGYCEYRSVAVVKIGQHCEISHNGLPVKVSPVIASSSSDNAMETNTPATHDYDHGDGLSTYMIDCGDDVHMCSICGYEHSGRQGLKKHLLVSHLNDYPYKCKHCEFAATESNQVQKHTHKCHPNLDPMIVHRNSPRPSFQGSEGDFGLAVKQEPRSPQPGTSSGQFFADDNHSDSQERKRRQQQNYEHNKRCELCSYSTKWNIHDLKVHVVTTHLHIQPYTCRFCVFGSRLRSVIVAHYKTQHNRMHENIEEHWENLQKALRVWEEGGFTYCGISEHASTVTMTYKPNIRRGHTSKYVSHVRQAAPTKPARPRPYPPPNEFPASGMLTEMSTALQDSPSNPPVQFRGEQPLDLTVKPIQGSVGLNFNPEQSSGIQHISLTATEPTTTPSGTQISGTVSLASVDYVLYGCKACDKKYSLRHMAQYHIMVDHLRMNPFMCSRCTFGARTREEVIDHTFNVHPNEEVTVLPAYMEHLDVQEYLISSTVGAQEYEATAGKAQNQPSKPSKMMSCSVCHERLPTSGALDEHMVSEHLDYSGFRCSYCGVYIKAKMQMRTHFQTKHPQQDIKYKAVKEGMACGKTLFSFPTATWLKNKTKGGGFRNVGQFTSGLSYSARGRMGGMARAKKSALQKLPNPSAVPVPPRPMNTKLMKEFDLKKIRQQCIQSGGTMEMHCKHCNYTSPNIDLMREHCYRHLDYRPFKCGYCGYASLLRKVLTRHIRTTHADQPESINKVVDNDIINSVPGHFIVNLNQGNSCVTIWNGSEDVSGLARPLKAQVAQERREKESMPARIEAPVPEPGQGEMFICVLCGEERDNRSNLLQHIMWELNYRPWSCPHCEFRDVTLLNVKNHCLNSHPGLPFKVVIQKDPERMSKIQALVERSRVSVDEEVIQDTSQQIAMDAGRNPATPFYSSTPTAVEQPKEDRFKPFSCSYCTMTAHNLSEISEHMEQVHPDRRPLNVFSLDEHHQPPVMSQEHAYPSASQIAASSNRVSLEPSVDPQAEGGILAQLEADLNRVITDSNQGGTGKFPRPTTGSKKTLSGSQSRSPKPKPDYPDGFIGHYVGVTVTDADLELGRDDVYYCRKCSYSSTKNNAVGHYVRMHTPPRWKCAYCDFKDQVACYVRRHIQSKHPGQPEDVVLQETEAASGRAEVVAPVEAELDTGSDISEDVEYGLSTSRSSSRSKKSLSNPSNSPAGDPAERPDGYMGTYDGITVTDADLKLDREGVYSCRKCPYLSTLVNAVGHYVRCHTAKRWKCPYCDFKSTITFHMRRHIRNKHHGRPVDVLPIEAADAYSTSEQPEGGVLSQLEAELDNNSDISEDVDIESDYPSLLKKTLANLQDSSAAESPERPEDIEYDPSYWTKSKKAQQEALGIIGKFDGVTVNDKHLLEDRNGDYSCRKCTCTFGANKQAAVNHYVRCHGRTRWKCRYCDFKYTVTYDVRKHCRKMHPKQPVDIVLIDTKEIDDPDSTAGNAKPTSKRPSTSSKPGPASSKKQKPNPTGVPSVFCCYLCNFKTDNTLKLIEHQRRHADPNAGSATKRSPSPNSEEAEDDQLGIDCPHCFYVAKSMENLKEHNREKHVFLRPFKCGYCDFSAFSKGKVRVHLQSNHEDEPEWILDQKEFADFETIDTASRMRRSSSTSRSTPATDGVLSEGVQHQPTVVITDNVSALPDQELNNLLKENNVRSIRW